MTITATTARTTPVDGTGSEKNFTVPFRFLAKADLTVVLREGTTDTVQTLDTHYTVSGVGAASGGTVTFVTAPTSAQKVIIINDPALTQGTDYIAGGTFPAETHEAALDLLTIQQQRTRDLADRSLKLSDGDYEGSGSFDASNYKIANLETPAATTDAATKNYVDSTVTNTVGPIPASSSYVTATGSTIARTLADRWKDVFNVKDFGAKGDNSTDDTLKVQAAINAASEGRKTIFFPEGIYICGALTSSDPEIKLVGASEMASTIKLKSGANDSLFTNTNTEATISLSHLKIDGNKAGNTAWENTVEVGTVDNLDVEHCTFVNGIGSVLHVTHVEKTLRIRNCRFSDGKKHSGTVNENTVYVSVSNTASDNTDDQYCLIDGNVLVGLDPITVSFARNGSTTATGTTTDLLAGMWVQGPGIPSGTTISSIAGGGGSIVLSSAATTTETNALTFGGAGIGGIHIRSNSGGDSLADSKLGPKCVIRDNFFKNCGQDIVGNRVAAINLYRVAPFSLIQGNRIFGCEEKGIDCQGSYGLNISHNHVENTHSTGIDVTTRDGILTCSRAIVTGNIVEGISEGLGIGCHGIATFTDATCDTTEDPTVTMNSTASVKQGMSVSGTGIPAGAIVASVTDGTHFELSAAATAVGTDVTLTFSVSTFDISVTNNIVDNCDRCLLIEDYYGSIVVTGNQFSNSTGTSTSIDSQAVSILSTHAPGTIMRDASVLFSSNALRDHVRSVYIYNFARNVVAAGNSFSDFTASGAAALHVVGNSPSGATATGSCVVKGNSFDNIYKAITAQNLARIVVSENVVNNTNSQTRTIGFDDFIASSSIAVTNNIITNAANEIIKLEGCLGTNFVNDNISIPGASIKYLESSAAITGNGFRDGSAINALANDATPSVAGGSTFTTGGTTTITDFDDGVVGQTITILSEHAITITDGTHIILHGSANFVMAASDSLTLILKADNKWYELSRMVNA